MTLRRGDIPYEQLESIYANADSRYLAFGDDMRVHFRDVGPRDGKVIMLVHGFSASLQTWEPWVTNLKRDYRVVSIDLPGHGLSRCLDNDAIGPKQFVETINRVANGLGIEHFTLAGNSMGGGAAWAYALAHPDRLDGLVLVDAAGWPRDEAETDSRPLVFKLLEIDLARRVMKDLDLSALIRGGLENSFSDPSFVTDEMVERYATLARAPCHREALLSLSAGRGRAHGSLARAAVGDHRADPGDARRGRQPDPGRAWPQFRSRHPGRAADGLSRRRTPAAGRDRRPFGRRPARIPGVARVRRRRRSAGRQPLARQTDASGRGHRQVCRKEALDGLELRALVFIGAVGVLRVRQADEFVALSRFLHRLLHEL
jgi:pimeloyl-ACP methyl ester carboxylesterase